MRFVTLPLSLSLLGVVAASVSVGCDRDPLDRVDTKEAPQAAPSRVAEALGLDAQALAEVPLDPTPAAGDLRAEVEGFTTLDACVAQHALDPLVGDAVRAIGYETFLRDACRVLEASKLKDVKKCSGIDAGGLRSRCQSAVAMTTSNVDACPWMIPDERAQGRDPTCIAVATHDARLCAGELRARRSTCEALADRNEARCSGAVTPNEQATCKREALRWKRLLDAPAAAAGKPFTPHATLDLRGAEGTPDPTQTSPDVTLDVARGVVLRTDRLGEMRFELGSRRELGSTAFVPGPGTRTRLAASVSTDAKHSSKLDHLELDVPGGTAIVVPGVRCECLLTITKIDPQRGGDVRLTVDGLVGVPPHAYKLKADVVTFVRDIVEEGRAAPGLAPTPRPTSSAR